MSRFKLTTTAVALALACSVSTSAQAQDSGIYQPLLSDFHVLSDDQGNRDVLTNQFIQFGKVFTGGFNYTDFDDRNTDEFLSAGVFFKPQLGGKDEFVIGTSFIKSQDGGLDDQFELQAKYTLASSLSFAAGFYETGVDGGPLDSDVYFARFSYNVPFAGGKIAISPLFQRQADDDEDVGLYAVYTNKSLLVGGGTDGEVARADINFAFPAIGGLKPAAEVLRVDETVGDIDGAKVLLFASTLDFSGGFLAQSNTVGRVSGPQAVYYNNPVSFTSATWNRGYDVWEYGKIANFRILQVRVPNSFGPMGKISSRSTDYSVALYPGQIIRGTKIDDPLQRIFVGFRHVENERGLDTDEPIIGYFGTLSGKFSASLSVTYDSRQDQGDIVLGLVYLH